MKASQRKVLVTIYATMITISSIMITQIISDSGDDVLNNVISSEGYDGYNTNMRGTKGPDDPLGFSPDLILTSINRSTLFTDNQALIISGTISADIKNQGDADTSANFEIAFFEDSNANGAYEISDNLLGSSTYSGILSAGTSTTVSGSISGNVLFRDNLIYAFVDSNDVIAEDNETNNLRNTGQDCIYRPPTGVFDPVLEWAWTGSPIESEWNQVMCAPAIGNLNDDNGDGKVDDNDIPDIIFNTWKIATGYRKGGRLRAISGDGSGELFTVTSHFTAPGCSPAVGDVDADGLPEIIVLEEFIGVYSTYLLVFENNGTLKWKTSSIYDFGFYGDVAGPSIADIDEDGTPEIIIGNYVFNNNGTLRWKGSRSDGLDISTVADLDMVGHPEIVAGNTSYRSDGTIYWQNGNVTEGRPAVGNFDDDAYPEVVVVGHGYISMLEHDGALKWGPYDIPPSGTDHDLGGPPTIGDFDGDGKAEIGVAGGYRYVVYEGNGTVKWSNEIDDYSSSTTGSSVFDFEGDGNAEAVYADEENLRIYNGSNGDVLWEYRLGSGTLLELPVIADVDNDNDAEIVMICNGYVPWSSCTGVYIFGDSNDNWVNTRKIWNQHAYHITNVNDNNTIPQYEKNNWEIYNNFRCQALVTNVFSLPDLSACYIRIDDLSFPASIDITARIGNGGAINVIAGVSIAFYDGDPSAGGTLIGTIPTGVTLAPGEYEDITITWLSPIGGNHDFYVVADDNGTGNGSVSEWNELNNIWHYAMLMPQPHPLVPPILYIKISQDREDAVLYWEPPPIQGIDHYLIYRSTSQTGFDFNKIWVDTSSDNETGEPDPIPLRTMWNDTNAAFPDNDTNYEEQYYYIIRAVNKLGGISTTSRTVGKWTRTFPQGISTFSLPLEPLETMNTTADYYLKDMNATYIKWTDPVNHIWMKRGEGCDNNTQLEVGKGYEVKFCNQTNYTFTGMPGAMIRYDDDAGFIGYDPDIDARNLTATVNPLTGNITLNWTKPSCMGAMEKYHVLRSTSRDGYWTGNYIQLANLSFDDLSYTDVGNATADTQYYYMILPVNETGVKGASTYSIGVWTANFSKQYDTLGIPLKIGTCETADWFCDNIPNTVGINYYNVSAQRWSWHSTRMLEGAFDPVLVMCEGYQISTSNATKYTFIGV